MENRILFDFINREPQTKDIMVKKKFLKGLIKRNPDGFGFLIPETKDHPDVYIPRHSMDGIMTNDTVLVDVFPESGSQKFRGEIIEVLKRGAEVVVGKIKWQNKKFAMLKDESHSWGADLSIPAESSMDAKDGDLVAAKILQYPEGRKDFLGKVIEIIGNIEDPLNDIKRVAMNQQIPMVFPEGVLRESKKFKSEPSEKDFKNRTDLRHLPLITIDGKTAKDFDDAVLTLTNQQGFLLYVAIADVSHYVQNNSEIDKEAYLRGNSVYFPNFVIPMLPEVLSNGLCSLNPNVPRLCVVAEMQFNFNGDKTSSKFYEAVMTSKARVTYGEAQELIEGVEIEKLKAVKENILKCADLAKVLMAKRFREGSLDLEIPETTLEIDASGVPVDVIRSERLFSHRLIEELMLASNVAVAEFLSHSDIPALYRIHESPNEDSIRTLERYLYNFGGKTKLDQGKLQKRLTRALQEFSGKPEAQVLNILTLRSMNQAKYSTNNLGHFGLGFEFYTHFTSPIRRYPDLIVHRLLKSQILKTKEYRPIAEEDLSTCASWLSSCEQKAAKSERQIHAIKKARFMEKFLGDEFEGMINSVARFGAFVLLREYDIDGLVKIDDLSTQRLEYDEKSLSLYNKKTGLRFTIGDTLKIKVISADHELGQINFMPLEVVIRKEKQNEQNMKEDFRKIKEEQKKKNQPTPLNFHKNKKTFAEKLFKKKKSGTHFKSNVKTKSENHKSSIKYRGNLSDEFFNPKSSESKVSIKQEASKESWKPQGLDYTVNSSKRSSILERLDQAIASREKNHHFSSGNKPHRNKENPAQDSAQTQADPHSLNKSSQQKEKSFGSGFKTEPSRKNSKKRSKAKNYRRGVR